MTTPPVRAVPKRLGEAGRALLPRDRYLAFGVPDRGKAEIDAAVQVMRSGWLDQDHLRARSPGLALRAGCFDRAHARHPLVAGGPRRPRPGRRTDPDATAGGSAIMTRTVPMMAQVEAAVRRITLSALSTSPRF